jgi:hypothetical protein
MIFNRISGTKSTGVSMASIWQIRSYAQIVAYRIHHWTLLAPARERKLSKHLQGWDTLAITCNTVLQSHQYTHSFTPHAPSG